jgi:glycine cleavage system H lipoate-binding protein
MIDTLAADPFATKGIEYLIVLAFLPLLVWFWRVLNRPEPAVAVQTASTATAAGPLSWFRLPSSLYYHPGHSWVLPEPDGLMRVGIDDFAQKLIGKPSALNLPEVGARLRQGDHGFSVQAAGKLLEMLSPVEGVVVARNEAALRSPEIVNEDPYDSGWLLEIKPARPKRTLKSLLHGKLAEAWLALTEGDLRQRMSGELGLVLQDGGFPVSGIARELSPDDWDQVAGEFLLTR